MASVHRLVLRLAVAAVAPLFVACHPWLQGGGDPDAIDYYETMGSDDEYDEYRCIDGSQMGEPGEFPSCSDASTADIQADIDVGPPIAYVTASGLNVRSGPGTEFEVIGGLRRCDSVLVLDEASSLWVEVYYDQKSGFVSSDYLTYDAQFCQAGSEPATSRGQSIPIDATQSPVGPEVEVVTGQSGCPNGCTTHVESCDIKGNISVDSGEKIYHVPGGEYYTETIIRSEYGERWFCTEDEAISNGWRRSSR